MLVELKSLTQHGGNWGYFVNSNEGGIKASAEVLKHARFAGKGVHLSIQDGTIMISLLSPNLNFLSSSMRAWML